ncbi:hypothetical protein TNCT_220061 [Trichonephila clavata]|uniref:TAZ-type domain-containing protein n=1 Tax=Trichonephila clavata TaxID=2740835 RepID=A0A8X6HE56_TRICU|nr:hypothetical protein TNCT_220061 [Trichonephila clavata]
MSLPTDEIVTEGVFSFDTFDPVHLEHASLCFDRICGRNMCSMVKASFEHFLMCLDIDPCFECEYFFGLAARHASNCVKENCSKFLCTKIRRIYNIMLPGTETSTEITNSEISHLYLPSIVPISKNFAEKLIWYIKKREDIFKEAMKSSKETVSSMGLVNSPKIPSTTSGFFQEPPNEILPFSQFAFQHSTPSTSRDVCQDQGDIEHRSKRFKKENVDDAFQPMDSSEF